MDRSDLIGKRVPVLDKGWIELQDVMGDDNAIVAAARASFLGESKGSDKDKKLLFYLLRHRHTTPFEISTWSNRTSGGCNLATTSRPARACWRTASG